MSFGDQSIKDFLRDLESDLPAPGGGSVAGLISALSGALNSMVYSLTVGKKAYMNLEERRVVCRLKPVNTASQNHQCYPLFSTPLP